MMETRAEMTGGCRASKLRAADFPNMMIRSIALAAAMAALVAAGVFYAASQPGWRTILRSGLEHPSGRRRRSSRPKIGRSAPPWPRWDQRPIGLQLDPDFAAGKKALVAEDWNGAIAALKLAALRDPRNADIQNYIGYAYRRLRQLGPAMQHYQQALVLNRRHRSAHEHLGETLSGRSGTAPKAEQQLAMLEDICLIPCTETDDLKRAIAAYKTLAMR